MTYVEQVMKTFDELYPGEPEFHQAVEEVLDSLKLVIDKHEDEYRETRLLERLL